MEVLCNKCTTKIIIQSTDIKINTLKNGIEETYFECPVCNAHYQVALMDNECKRLESVSKHYLKNYHSHKTMKNWKLYLKAQKDFKKALEKLNAK